MNERVEEIRRQEEDRLRAMAECVVGPPGNWFTREAVVDIVMGWLDHEEAALAQVEQERDDEQRLRVQLSEDSQRHLDQFVEARAEVERLLAALAQAEREREDMQAFAARQSTEIVTLVGERDAARAALEKAETFAREIAKRSVRDDHRRQAWAIIIEARVALGGRDQP